MCLPPNNAGELQERPIPSTTTRILHNVPGSQYVLPSDQQEADRLNAQHAILKRAFGNKCLFVPLEGRPAYFVLDSGTGTGIWLEDAAPDLSSSSILHGIDIHDRLFPHTKPPNISFSITDVTSLPLEWSSRFDIVHQRLLFAALTRSQWSAALANIYGVLRPGGWVQLCEGEKIDIGQYTQEYRALLEELYGRRGLVIEVFEELPQMLKDAGFVDVTIDRADMLLGKWAGQRGIEGRDNMMDVFRALKLPILRMGGFNMVNSEAEIDELLGKVEKEWDATEGMAMGFRVFVARKPEA